MKKLQQFKVYAFTYERLALAKFKINTNPFEAELRGEVVSLGDNECLRAIRRIRHRPFVAEDLQALLDEKMWITRRANSAENKRRIKEINNEMRDMLFVPEIITVTTPHKRNYTKIGRDGFFVNGVHYIRLMCSAAMARTNRALFCAEDIYEPLDEILRCGSKQIKIVPAKWNAYYSLMSSATHIVSFPRVCVVKDYEIKLPKMVDWVTDNEIEDTISYEEKELPFNIWDGMGLISPEQSKKWSEELGYDGIAECFIVRAPFIKGLVATFDFHKFAREVAHNGIIKDIYGKEYHCDDIDMVLTESQFKLWGGYDSIESHQDNMKKYGLSWGVSRIGAPDGKKILKTNYQFLQVLNLKDDDIKELCSATVGWIDNLYNSSIEYKLLYLMGKLSQKNCVEAFNSIHDSAVKALLLEPRLMGDSYISDKIVGSIRKKINEALIGKIMVKGNFYFVVCDPYALCEYIFGLEPKGLLKEFEHYAYLWSIQGEQEISALRSPMTWRAEVNKLSLRFTEEMQAWYKYIPNCVVLNMWGLDREIFSGSDFDGDILALTSHNVFKKCRYGGAPVLYEHKKAAKDTIE